MKKANWFGSIIFLSIFIIIGILSFYFVKWENEQMYENYDIPEDVYLSSFSEAECYQICDGEYFFDSGFFGSDNCVCKEQGGKEK